MKKEQINALLNYYFYASYFVACKVSVTGVPVFDDRVVIIVKPLAVIFFIIIVNVKVSPENI